VKIVLALQDFSNRDIELITNSSVHGIGFNDIEVEIFFG
jgi:hypothetical protein